MRTVILNPMPSKIKGDLLADRFRRVGGNPGNLVFYESVKAQINYDEIIDFNGGRYMTSEDSVIVPLSGMLEMILFFKDLLIFLIQQTVKLLCVVWELREHEYLTHRRSW